MFSWEYIFLAVMCGAIALLKLDFHFSEMAKRYVFASPIQARWNLFKSYLQRLWAWRKERTKKFWFWCGKHLKSLRSLYRRLLSGFRRRFTLVFTYMVFFGLCYLFGSLFFERLYPIIEWLYMAVKDGADKAKNIDPNSKGFRNISLSIAGSITVFIAVLGMVLTVIRNILIRQQNRTDEERLVTEQLSRAIDQIGAYKQKANTKVDEANIEVRLGGLYALHRIMRNSPEEEENIAEILYAYVRENAKKPQAKKP